MRSERSQVGAFRLRVLLWMTLLLVLRLHQASAQATPTPNQPPAAPTATAPLRRQTTIPYVPALSGGEPLIQVTIDGKVTGTFMVDTGAGSSLITTEMAAKLGLTPQPAILDGHPFLVQGKPAKSVSIARLQIGTWPLSDLVFVATPKSQMGPYAAADGVIGNNVLKLFAVLFDFPAHRITLWYPAGLSPAEVRAAGFDPANAVPITDPNNYWVDYVEARLSSGSVHAGQQMEVDTGSDVTTVSADTARRLNLAAAMAKEATIYGGSIPFLLSHVPVMRLGPLTLHDQTVAYPMHSLSTLPASLGMNVLSHYCVLLDYNKAMYLQPAPPPALTVHIGPTPTHG